MGNFDWDRVNPNGGSVAIGHPFGATGARDLSQAVKELWAMPVGSLGIVSICADGGQGTVALLENASDWGYEMKAIRFHEFGAPEVLREDAPLAVASSRHEAFLRELGADEFIDYTQTSPKTMCATSISSSTLSAARPRAAFCRPSARAARCSRFFLGFAGHDEAAGRGVTVSATQVRSNGDQLAKLAQLLDSGAVRVAVDSTFPLSSGCRSSSSRVVATSNGKIVLTIGAAADQSRDTGGPSSRVAQGH